MEKPLSTKLAWLSAITLAGCLHAAAQAPGVPVYRQGRQESQYEEDIRQAARALLATGHVLKLAAVKEQLQRPSCQLDLPKVKTARLTPPDICLSARRSHLRVGWLFLCDKCDDWHVNLAGGYVLTTNGAVATCYHVVQPDSKVKDGCLVAADENAKVFAVTEVLAANRYSDVCILRVAGQDFTPLALNTNVFPGDIAYCYSDPLDHRGFFSQGLVNRFYQFPGRRPFSAPPAAAYAPTRIDVGTDWAPGSSGSAVLDECANAIGHVSTIAAVNETESADTDPSQQIVHPTMIVFHEAVSARDVLRLITSRSQ
ncbi:MAG: serine protease [Verrucomicrobiota bacterium]|jgi:hypothetical protein